MKKRILSILLALCMLFCLVPTTAFAEGETNRKVETEQELVDALADRLVFREFDNDNFELNEIFQMNNPDVFFDSSVLSALIASCCFVYISPGDEEGIPRLQVVDAANATGVIDPITGLLKEGYAVLSREDNGKVVDEAYFLPERTVLLRDGKITETRSHVVPHPLLVPIIHRPDAVREEL